METDDDASAPTEKQLFVLLGGELLSASRMGSTVTDNQKEQLGESWFRGHLKEMREAVCGNSLVEDLASKSDTPALVAAISPLLAFAPTTVAAATVSLLLARIGIRRICAGEWS